MLTLDARHTYRGYWEPGAVCRVRVYQGTDALPVVVVTQLPENQNTSITNMCEYLGAEILLRYLGQQDGLALPYHYVEHYPDDCQHPAVYHPRGMHQANYSEERFSLVRFAHYNPSHKIVFHGVQRVKFGRPDWQYLDVAELERMLGERWTPEFEADYPQRVATSA